MTGCRLMGNFQKDWERYESRQKVLLAFIIVEFLIPFRLLGDPVSDYFLGGHYSWFVGLLIWMLLAGLTISILGRFPCPRCGKKMPVLWKAGQAKCAGCGLTARES
jgi:hypothetical protein